MKWRLATADPEEELGVYAHELPQCSGITPAPFPEEVIAWEKAGKPSARQATTSLVPAAPVLPKAATGKRVAAPSALALADSEHPTKKAKAGKPDEIEELPNTGYSLIQKGVNTWFLAHTGVKMKAGKKSDS